MRSPGRQGRAALAVTRSRYARWRSLLDHRVRAAARRTGTAATTERVFVGRVGKAPWRLTYRDPTCAGPRAPRQISIRSPALATRPPRGLSGLRTFGPATRPKGR